MHTLTGGSRCVCVCDCLSLKANLKRNSIRFAFFPPLPLPSLSLPETSQCNGDRNQSAPNPKWNPKKNDVKRNSVFVVRFARRAPCAPIKTQIKQNINIEKFCWSGSEVALARRKNSIRLRLLLFFAQTTGTRCVVRKPLNSAWVCEYGNKTYWYWWLCCCFYYSVRFLLFASPILRINTIIVIIVIMYYLFYFMLRRFCCSPAYTYFAFFWHLPGGDKRAKPPSQ